MHLPIFIIGVLVTGDSISNPLSLKREEGKTRKNIKTKYSVHLSSPFRKEVEM